MRTYLTTINNNAKSFGNKAIVADDIKEGTITLISYNTEVAELKGNSLKINGWFSATTAKHIKEFALQNGFESLTKKEMELKPTIVK